MDIPWGSKEAHKFVTNVGMITSDGPHGPNVMAAEWTHLVSYRPGIIMVNVGYSKATHDNILAGKKFGVNIAAIDQNVLSSVAGGSSGKDVDKIAVMRELGTEFYKGKNGLLMIKDAALNAECNLMKAEKMGDHMMFIGEVTDVSMDSKEPLAYHAGRYFHVREEIEKPSQAERDKIAKIVEKHRKK